jgi:membrane fusion protein, multidrug efflux system
VQAAQAVVDQARAQLELAELGMKDTRVTAPVDGRVAERLVAPGALVSPQTPIVTLVPPTLELVVNINEGQLGQVGEGQAVQIQVPAYPNVTFNGTVTAISPTLEAASRTAAVRIAPIDDQSRLRAGMFARLSIVTALRQKTLLVPREAIQTAGGSDSQSSVLVIDAAQTVHRAPVQVGLLDDRFAEIVGGLDEDDLVATSGLADLIDGDVVAPRTNSVVALAAANQGAK